jgi:hypothetical protein
MLRKETGRTLGAFLFEDVLCRWGAVEEIVMDNGSPFVVALDWLTHKYHIRHIQISTYNLKANGLIEQSHRTIQDSLVKSCNGDITQWPTLAHHVFWADCVMTRKSTGHTPFFMTHGIEPVLPFDITKATYLLPDIPAKISMSHLIAIHARQLAKQEEDLADIHAHVLKSRFTSIRDFERQFSWTIHDYDFKPGTLVLVLNKKIEPASNAKCKPRYFGPMVMVSCSPNGPYHLTEVEGTLLKLKFTTFRLIPYHPRSPSSIEVMQYIDPQTLVDDEPENN